MYDISRSPGLSTGFMYRLTDTTVGDRGSRLHCIIPVCMTFLGHRGSVRGLCIDGLTQLLVTGGADCTVKFWKFKTKKLLHEVTVADQVAAMLLHRERCGFKLISNNVTKFCRMKSIIMTIVTLYWLKCRFR